MLAFNHPLLKQLFDAGRINNPILTVRENPNCITKAVENGKLGKNNIYDNTGKSGHSPSGKAGHDGIHVNIPLDTMSPVTALPAMTGVLKFFRFQETEGRIHNLDILLNNPINGEKYYLILKDIFSAPLYNKPPIPRKPLGYARTPGPRNIPVTAGLFLGYICGGDSKNMYPELAESGLHVTLLPAKFYSQFYANQNPKPIEWFMDAARDPRSPFKCS